MKPFSVNLSKFKKIAHDKKSTVLRDPDGHEIRIVHSAIPAIQRKQLEGLPMYAEGGGVAAADEQKPVTVNVNQVPERTSTAPAAQFAQQPVDVVATQPAKPTNIMAKDQTLDVPSAAQLEQKAIREQQAIEAAKGAAAANVEQGYNNQKAQIVQQEQNNVTAVKQHADEFAQHIQQNPINNNHWAESQTTGQRVLNALGLIAGGFKQGLVGGNNPAMDFINTQIERDVAAQRARADQQRNVYGAYRELYGDQMAATSAAKASMLDVYTHKMNQIAAQLGTPQAQANADAFAAKAALEKNQLLLETSGRLGIINVGQPLTQTAPVPQRGSPAQQSAQSDQMHANTAAAPAIEQAGLGTLARGVSSLLERNPSHAAEEREELSKPRAYNILSQNAQSVINGMQYSTPADKADYEKITEQLKQAQQAEKVLNGPNGDGVGGIHDLVQRMYKNSGSGSYISGASLHFRENARDAAESVPLVGQALRGAIDLAPKDRATKQYETGKAALLSDLATGLQGVLAPTDIEKIVKPNLPALGDSPNDVADKERAMVSSILKALKTNMLEKKGLYVKPKI